jgi:hypothetical protein
MTYQDDADAYRDPVFRARAEMCAREQGYMFSADGRADIAGLGRGVVAGTMVDIDAVIAAVVVAPGNEGLEDDGALLSATQAVWPTVAAARYPQSP